MKTQEQINAAWNVNVPCSICTLGMLVPPRIETKLKKPYQYELPASQVTKLVADLKKIEKTAVANKQVLYFLVDTKPTKYGCRLHIWMDARGRSEKEPDGCSREDWDVVTTLVSLRLQQDLKPEVYFYIEPWRDDYQGFQARLETYIKYAEL